MKLNPAMTQPFFKLLAYRERSRNYPSSPALGRLRRAGDWEIGAPTRLRIPRNAAVKSAG